MGEHSGVLSVKFKMCVYICMYVICVIYICFQRDENDETFTVTFKTNDDIDAGKDPTATVTIVDDDSMYISVL